MVRVSELGLLMASIVSSTAAFQCTSVVRSGRFGVPLSTSANLRLGKDRLRSPRRPMSGTRRLVSQLDPAKCAADSSHVLHALAPMYLAVDAAPLEDVQEYIMSHPLQDAVGIALMVFTLVRFLLSLCITAGSLQLFACVHRTLPAY